MLSKQACSSLISKTHIPGLSAVAIVNGTLSAPISVGLTDASLQPPVQVNDETVFRAASLTKPLFAYLVLKLAQQGRFNLKQPLAEILPFELLANEPACSGLTAEMVLAHTTGIPGSEVGPNFGLLFKPGTEYNYSGIAYIYLQKLIEKHTGKSLEALAKELIFSPPLNMNHSSFLRPEKFVVAVGHDEKLKPQPLSIDRSDAPAISAFSLHTTASDYAQFILAWMNDPALQNAFKPVVSMTTDQWAKAQNVSNEDLQKLSWGLGWGLQKTSEGTIAYHWGDMGESKAFVAINLDTKNAIVYLTNSVNGLSIARELATPIVGDLTPAFNYLFKKYGYEHHTNLDWEEKQKFQTWQMFAKYEIRDKAAWLDDLIQQKTLEVENKPQTKILKIKCEPDSLFSKVIKQELEAFKYNHKLKEADCILTSGTDASDQKPYFEIHMPNEEHYLKFIQQLSSAKLLPLKPKPINDGAQDYSQRPQPY